MINLNHVNDLTRFEVKSCVSGQGKELHHPKRLNLMYVTALFANMRTLKFKSRPRNCVFGCRQS